MRTTALRQERSYNGSARIDSRGWQRNYAPNRRIFTYVGPFRSDLMRLVMTATPYVAGPDVFLPNAAAPPPGADVQGKWPPNSYEPRRCSYHSSLADTDSGIF